MESSASRRFELLDSFAANVSSDSIALDEAFLTIAAVLGDGFDIVEHLVVLDELASEVPTPTVEGIARHLFSGPGAFIGNVEKYYDADNSLFDKVLATRRGIPITLSVLMVEVARRLGVRLVGVGMPGHFLVGTEAPFGRNPDMFVDPFHGGAILDAHDCRNLFMRLTRLESFDSRYLAAVHPIAILDRALNNLKAVYLSSGEDDHVRTVMSLRSRLPGLGATERDEFLRMMAPFN